MKAVLQRASRASVTVNGEVVSQFQSSGEHACGLLILLGVEQGDDELSEADISQKLEELGPFDPKRDLSRYTLPSIELLRPHGGQGPQINKEELEENKNKIVETLNHYNLRLWTTHSQLLKTPQSKSRISLQRIKILRQTSSYA